MSPLRTGLVEVMDLRDANDESRLRKLQKLRICEVTSCDMNVNHLLAVGSSDKTVRILEWKLGLGFVDVFYSPLIFHKYAVTSVRFSPKGTILASASLDGTAVLIDVLKGTKIFTAVQDNTPNVKFCEFTVDCKKLITAADDGSLCFWDLFRRRQIRHCRLHEEDYALRGVAVSPDSEFLLSMDSGNLLKMWYMGDEICDRPRCFFLKKDIHDDVLCCEFSPVKNIRGGAFLKLDYCVATCCANGFVKIWKVVIERRENSQGNLECFTCDMTVIRILEHDKDILSIRFNAGGNYIVSTGLNNLGKLWEVEGGRCLGTLEGHARYVTSAAFSKDSLLLVTGSVDGTLIIWTLSKKLSLDTELSIPCNVSCHFTNVDLINYHIGKCESDQEEKYKEFTVRQKLIFPSVINSVLIPRDDVLAVAGGQSSVEIWKKQRGKFNYEQWEILTEPACGANHLDASPCGNKIISCSPDGTITILDLNMSLMYDMKTPDPTAALKTCKFSPDSKLIAAAGDDQKVYMWDANNLEFLKIMQRHENTVTSLAFTSDGEFLVTTCGSDVILQNVAQKKLTAKVSNAHDLGARCCDFSCAPASDIQCTNIYDNSSRYHGENKGKHLLATGGNDSLVKLWTVSVTEIFGSTVLSGHGGSVNCVKFSSVNPFILASCSSDTTVRIWETKSQHCQHVLNYHQLAVTTCAFSKDSTLLVTGSLDKSVFMFDLTTRSCHEPTEQDRNRNKPLENWTPSDTANWFQEVGRQEVADKIRAKQISGKKLFSFSDDDIAALLEFPNEKEQKQFRSLLLSLKNSFSFPSDVQRKEQSVPHEFLCPITHQLMKEPVICTDGYIYDRAAITEWFLSGKLISPITKECLKSTKLLPYSALKINIHKFLHKSE